MQVIYDGEEYTFDLEEITVAQAKIIKLATGFTLSTLEDALQEADPDAMRAVFWLMCAQSGKPANIDTVDFKMVAFLKSMQEATQRESEAQKAAEKAAKRAANPTRKATSSPS